MIIFDYTYLRIWHKKPSGKDFALKLILKCGGQKMHNL